jgi:hypothetical protein
VTQRSKLNLANYLPYLINRVGSVMVSRFTAEALVQHGLSSDMWRVLAGCPTTANNVRSISRP